LKASPVKNQNDQDKMLKLQFPLPVKFICGFIYSSEETYKETIDLLEGDYGPIDFSSEAIDFTFTKYYCSEMGKSLQRKFISFKNLQDPANFVAIKLAAVDFEKKFSSREKRKINIDPGYINEAKLVLLTTKDYAHRVYLNDGIFAETTLVYRDGNFVDLPYTFPDYRTDKYKEIFLKIRSIYQKQIRDEAKN